MTMKNLAENNVIRFVNITKKKDGLFVNFKVRGIRAGTLFSASISVDVSAAELNTTDPLDKIIEECARIGLREFKKAEFEFIGTAQV